MTDLRKTAEEIAERACSFVMAGLFSQNDTDDADSVAADVADAIHKALEAARDEALEQCAVRMETWTLPRMVFPSGWEITREDMAAEFRALKPAPQGERKP